MGSLCMFSVLRLGNASPASFLCKRQAFEREDVEELDM